MARTYRKKLDDEELRQEFLQIVRNTGSFGKACSAANISAASLSRYRNDHQEFDNACHLAKAYAEMKQRIHYDVQVRFDAWKEIHARVKNHTAKDGTLIRIVEGITPK
jgi:hypothetical protein